MPPAPGIHSLDNQRLRRYLRDLAALTALPAVWGSRDRPRIAESLAEVLGKVLHLDLIYVRLEGTAGQDTVEVVRFGQQADVPGQAQVIGQALEPWLTGPTIESAAFSLPHPLGDCLVQATFVPIGYGSEFGVLVAGSQLPDFPTEEDRLLLSVVANQAAVVLQRQQAEAALQESDRRKDEFLAMLAHELRNPLAPIRNALQILRAKGPPDPELQWARNVIDRQVRQMTRLVDDLLDLSRISQGKIELRKERAQLATIVTGAVEASRPLIEKWGHELTVTLPSEPIYLQADQARLTQVVLNLLNNAAKYTDHGGRIWLSAARDGAQVVVRIRDSGIGIPAEMLSRIFEIFTQVDRSLERSQGGLGIGLTLVQRLVQLHGGTVEARSDGPGKGSEFIVRLPVVAAEDEAKRLPKPSGPAGTVAPAPARRILIVDDNKDAADSLGILLGLLGHEVQTAYDGLEAVGAAAAFQPDAILLDIGLPKLNGYEAASRIREQQGDEVALIALTGWGQEADRRRSREAGFDQHLTKPVEFDALEKLLHGLQPRVGCPQPAPAAGQASSSG